MFDINALVNASLINMAESGRLAEVIAKHTEKSIEDAVKDAVSWNSEFQKSIKEAVKTSIAVDVSRIGMVGYNDMVVKIIKAQLDKHMEETISRDVCKNLEELLKPAPTEYTLSKLVDEFKEWIVGIQDREDDEITLIVESPYGINSSLKGYRRIYLDKKSGTSKHECSIRLTIDINRDSKIINMEIDGKDPKKALFAGDVYGFERTLFQFYTSGTKLILNEGDCDITFYDDNEGN